MTASTSAFSTAAAASPISRRPAKATSTSPPWKRISSYEQIAELSQGHRPQRSPGDRLSDRDRRGGSLHFARRPDGDAQQSGADQNLPRSGTRRRHSRRG